jgi:prepilin-type processing-associated H-X9-DG protein
MTSAATWLRGGSLHLRWCVAFSALLVAVASWSSSTRGQDLRAHAAAGAVAAPLGHYVPRKDLALFVEFDGMDSNPAAWRASAAFKLWNDTALGTLLEDLCIQVTDLIQESAPPGSRISGSDVVELIKILGRSGFVIAGFANDAGQVRPLLVLRRGDRAQVRQLIQGLAAATAGRTGDQQEKNAPEPVQKAGRKIHTLSTNWVSWAENGDLILAERSKADEILAVIDGKQQSALDHPVRLQLAKADVDTVPAAVGFVDAAAVRALAPDAIPQWLDGLQRIEMRFGFDGKATVTTLRAVAPAPRRGLLALFEQPQFGAAALPPLPAGLSGFSILSIDLVKSYDHVLAEITQDNPSRAVRLPIPAALAREGLDLRRDLLAHLGPKVALYDQTASGAGDSPAAMIAARLAGLTISIQVRDHGAVAGALDPITGALNRFLRQQRAPRRNPGDRMASILSALEFERQIDQKTTYTWKLRPNTLPAPFSEAIRPTVLLGPDQLVISGSREAAERALAAGPRWQPAEAFVPLVRRLPAEMIYLNIGDLRSATPLLTRLLPIVARQVNTEMAMAQTRMGKAPRDVYLRLDPAEIPQADDLNRLLFPSSTTIVVDADGATLSHREPFPSLTSPAACGGLLALLWPAIRSRHEAARRAQCVNSLKQIALALHNYHSVNNAFPRPALTDDNEKPLLSWRVAILPYLGHQELYDKFKLDEPWDSPHNKALAKEMPDVYLCQARQKVQPFTTSYRVFTGKGALFEHDQDIGVGGVTDGTSNTILVVESAESVPWTKPDDLVFDPEAAPSLYGAGSPHPGGFSAAFADGSVRFLKTTIAPHVFRNLITRNAGEVVDHTQF